jgi:predicted nucleic acid binding AN1-type Zn finger protein
MSVSTNSASPLFSVSQTSLLPSTMTLENGKEAKTTMKRCCFGECRRKLMISDFACKCGHRFCTAHRHAEEHKCAFDFRAAGLANLSTTLVKCAGNRLPETI